MLAGGASQEAWLVDVALAGAPDPLRLVMRRDMGGALTTMALDRATEFAVLQVAYAGGVPAPRPYFAPATIAGKAAFFMERVDGETVGRKIVTEPSLAEARAALQFNSRARSPRSTDSMPARRRSPAGCSGPPPARARSAWSWRGSMRNSTRSVSRIRR